MFYNEEELDLIKGIPWREQLHPRGADGKFRKIKSGSKVVAKNGTVGKVKQITDTHYHIEKEDGKTSKIMKDNVIHEKDHKELTTDAKKAKKGASKTTSGKGHGTKTESESSGSTGSEKQSGKTKQPTEEIDSGVVLFHGTALTKLESIINNGFRVNGDGTDFGNAVYFKSPVFDEKDKEDHQAWIKKRLEKNQKVPERYLKEEGNTTKKVVGDFTHNKFPLVIQAKVAKQHILDCTNGRPKDLEKMLNEFEKALNEGTNEALRGYALKHILGMNIKDMDDETIYVKFQENRGALKKLWGRELNPMNMSPYEIYAKKKGIGAIVDKLRAYTDEGWQIGVYDPKLIDIIDHGKGVENKNGIAELVKALLKALTKASYPYALLHHEFDSEGNLILHVGVHNEDVQKGIYTVAKPLNKSVKSAITSYVLESGKGDMTSKLHVELKKAMLVIEAGYKEKDVIYHYNNLRKSIGYTKRSAYNVADSSEVIYIPINRLKTPYQTEEATNFDKVQENFERMKLGENLEPVVIGFDYDLHDGHHRVEASRKMDYTHVPCVVMNTHDEIGRQRAIEAYKEVWKSFNT